MEAGSTAREEGQEKANMGGVESPESTGGREVESHCKGQRGLLEDKTLRAATRFQPLRHLHAQKASEHQAPILLSFVRISVGI